MQKVGSIATLKRGHPGAEVIGALEIEQGFWQRLELLLE